LEKLRGVYALSFHEKDVHEVWYGSIGDFVRMIMLVYWSSESEDKLGYCAENNFLPLQLNANFTVSLARSRLWSDLVC